MLDGRHTGTGGGNHIVLGGPTPADSPFLRRPDLLRSLVSYWHNHPSLSYLFSGLFIGPTSQHPRVDEARNDSLLRARDRHCAHSRTTGSRRRGWSIASSATCSSTSPATRIAPSSASTSCTRRTRAAGRLGLVELRAFEMPPHARMSLTQQLLLRALDRDVLERRRTTGRSCAGAPSCTIASCCRTSSRRISTTCWTTCGAPAIRCEPEWFAPHCEFRFPPYGSITQRGVHVELRQALEPWHVTRRGAGGGRHGALRGFVGRAPAGQGERHDRLAAHHVVQRPARAAASDGTTGRIRGRRALSRVAAAELSASDDPRARAAGLRHRGHLESTARSAAARITWRIRADGASRRSR